ncbi:MAG: RluA family pseudouridine synthase, partial [Oscillospiraceae bacterium]|nr:RluA family pseudouridine synthase [Oscillospiraceae bacterium]
MTVLYQDQYITVCTKPSGVSSEDTTAAENGMPGLLRAAWGSPNAYVGVVHRLDVGVSGVMVYARTPAAAAALSAQVAD